MYIKITNNEIVYPYDYLMLKNDNPGVCFPVSMSPDKLADWGVYPVQGMYKPEHNSNTHKAVEIQPALIDGIWVQQWSLEPLSEIDILVVKSKITESVQHRLDNFARTRGYDDIKSASDYAGDEDAQFNSEGTYCKTMRSRTWRALINIMNEVEAGTRTMPTSYTDIEAELPVLEWPA